MPIYETPSNRPLNRSSGFFIRSRRIVTPDGIRAGAILVCDGTIAATFPYDETNEKIPLFDAGNHVVMPGIVDTHVHVNEPGRSEWEGFETATRAAAAGGITTLIDMPLNSIPVTTSATALKEKIKATEGRLWVDCGFWGGLIPGNIHELPSLVEEGVRGFKAFLLPSGIEEFPPVAKKDLEKAMPILARLRVPLLVHAELEIPQKQFSGDANPRLYKTYLETKSKEMENEAVKLLLNLCRKTGCAVHIVHLSSAEAIPMIAQAKKEGLPFTAETCPHYLFFAAEEIQDGHAELKCSPPIREKENQDRLWEALKEGLIRCIVSDHSPCAPELKESDFLHAWGGISSLQFSLSAVWTEARKRGFSISDLARWMCEEPARLAGFSEKKGKIAPGYDADFAVWNPEKSFIVRSSQIQHRHKTTPYLGRALYGSVEVTFLRGKKIFEQGKFAEIPSGEILNPHERLYRTR